MAPETDTALKASPIARRMADEHGLDLDAVVGTGPEGRVVKADVLAAVAGGGSAGAPEPPDANGDADADRVRREPLSGTQRVIARRMVESRTAVPDFTVEVEVAMDAAVALREQLRVAAAGAPVPSYNDLVVRACALALREHPRVNGTFTESGFDLHEGIHVGIAVAAPDALLVPVITDADRRPLGEIAQEARRLGERARAGALTPAELSGGTFTVSNLGMFGVSRFTAVIDQPQSAILAVGGLRRVPVVSGDVLVPGHLMALTIASDHRIIYGADAARFLARVRELLEAPLSLLVG